MIALVVEISGLKKCSLIHSVKDVKRRRCIISTSCEDEDMAALESEGYQTERR
jgi:hypothetical protein